MLNYPDINPIALKIGPLAFYWYGIMYLLGFLGAYWLCWRRRLQPATPWKTDDITDLCFYSALGVIFGGTLGYLLFYEPHALLQEPLRVLTFWEPGRSFHGGLLGVLLAILFFCRTHHRRFWEVTDFIAPAVPFGLATGRLGNFINAELWGRVTDKPWGMVFSHAGILPRHPSQLYEFILEGVALLVILQWYSRKRTATGSVSGLFLIWYGIFRFVVEFFREPDPDQGFIVFHWVTKGQILSLPMIIIGLIIFLIAKRHQANKG